MNDSHFGIARLCTLSTNSSKKYSVYDSRVLSSTEQHRTHHRQNKNLVRNASCHLLVFHCGTLIIYDTATGPATVILCDAEGAGIVFVWVPLTSEMADVAQFQ